MNVTVATDPRMTNDQLAAGAPIAYIVSRFPKLSETFILREVMELERQGASVHIFPLVHHKEPIYHSEIDAIQAKVHYTPFINRGILAANMHFLLRSPVQYLELLLKVVAGNLRSFNFLLRAIALFPKSVFFAKEF